MASTSRVSVSVMAVAPHGNSHAALPRQAVAQHRRVGYQRVRGVHAGQQHRGDEAIAEHRPVDDEAHDHGHYEGHYAVGERPDAVLAEVAHVHLQPGKQHYVEQPHVPEYHHRPVVGQDVESVRPHYHPRQHHAHYVRYAQLGHNDGRKEYDEQHDEECYCRRCYGQVLGQVGHKCLLYSCSQIAERS